MLDGLDSLLVVAFRRLKPPARHAPHSKQPQPALLSSPAAPVLPAQRSLTAVKATADRKVPGDPRQKGFAATTALHCDGPTQQPISSAAGARDNVATTRETGSDDDGVFQLLQSA